MSPLLFNIVLKVLSRGVRQEEEIKSIHIGNEKVKWSLFADDMILCIKSPKDATKKLLETINKHSKVVRHKINAQKSIVFLYIDNGMPEKEVMKKFHLNNNKKNKIPRNKLSKGSEGLIH